MLLFKHSTLQCVNDAMITISALLVTGYIDIIFISPSVKVKMLILVKIAVLGLKEKLILFCIR